ncbi:MAG: penicillin-binding protein 1A [Francisellaceae bacterium]|nr:penicillin-binding protein 1A [Francisellaceae bacterium]MBT6206648.1 penicillin-binding protein 1A [Francisellaceae bacterium]MBT6538449.1 penicillin-binding protein 1A [Francisellaceae bacterium]
MKYLNLSKILFTVSAGFAIAITVAIVHLEMNLPSVDSLKDIKLQVPLKIYTKDDKLIAEYGEKRRDPVSISQVPKELINAILATEDRRFYQHPGVDLRGILRAASSLILKGTKEQGGSTITMQVARNFFLSRNKTFARKFNEILLALKIEQELSKDEILELYLNKIYLGKRSYGVGAAAEVYYGKKIDELTLAEMAMIAGLPQAPSSINPINSPEHAEKRRSHVLRRMLHYGYINEQQFTQADLEPIETKYHGRSIEVSAPFVAEMVRQELVEKFGEHVYEIGLDVYTTIDSKLQISANKSVYKSVIEYDQRHAYRGAIKNLPMDNKLTADNQLKLWQAELSKFPRAGNLAPAIVTNLDKDKAFIIFRNGHLATIDFEQMTWARRKNSHNNLGPKPKVISDAVTIGDVIYAQSLGADKWRLAQRPEVQGALVALSPETGDILALVGGFDFALSPFNRATQAQRQPGSSIKPFIYGAALENGFTTASIINDAPVVQDDPTGEFDWRPQNHTHEFYGPTRLRVGITKSRNMVSIRLLKSVGLDITRNFLSKFGFDLKNLPNSLSLALGTNHTTPLTLAAAYSAFPNGGYSITPNYIHKILNYSDKTIYEHNIPEKCEMLCSTDEKMQRIIDPQIAYLMTSLLQDAVQSGTGRTAASALRRGDIAGKTGTTNDQKDTWYSGYNNDIVVTTWMGFDEPRTLHEYAVRTALPMWINFMSDALKDKPHSSQAQPEGMVTVKIDPKTGLLARSEQNDAIFEIFTKDTVPTQIAPSLYSASKDNSSTIESLF